MLFQYFNGKIKHAITDSYILNISIFHEKYQIQYPMKFNMIETFFRGTLVAQLVKHTTLGLGVGHDNRVMSSSPM